VHFEPQASVSVIVSCIEIKSKAVELLDFSFLVC